MHNEVKWKMERVAPCVDNTIFGSLTGSGRSRAKGLKQKQHCCRSCEYPDSSSLLQWALASQSAYQPTDARQICFYMQSSQISVKIKWTDFIFRWSWCNLGEDTLTIAFFNLQKVYHLTCVNMWIAGHQTYIRDGDMFCVDVLTVCFCL